MHGVVQEEVVPLIHRRKQQNRYISLWLMVFFLSLLIALILFGIKKSADLTLSPTVQASGLQKNEGIESSLATLNQDFVTIEIPLYRTASEQIEKLPLEEYLIGVVAAEMPIEFELEALKAQAITARTYLIRRIAERDFSGVPVDAWVNDTVQHQAYLDDDALRRLWGTPERYEKNRARIEQAVQETEGLVITYQGRPIHATFFSTSNGYTENSEEYWQDAFPYLRSVASPWDRESPKYTETIQLSRTSFEQKLGVKLSGKESQWFRITEQTTGKRVKQMYVGDQEFSGREVRERLELNSSSFTIKAIGSQSDVIEITTYGYGHGVGMSQWGANGLAKEGSSAEDILRYYYQGIELTDYRQWVKESS